MKYASLVSLCLITSSLSLTACDTLQPRFGEIEVQQRNAQVRVVFNDSDRNRIRDYYGRKYKGLPPGLAKQGKVPPGHAMQMERDLRLASGAAYRSLPDDLERQLSRLPEGYIRIVLGADIGIMDTRTRIVVDVIKDIAIND